MKRIILFFLQVLFIKSLAFCQCEFLGPWHGNLNIQGQKLPIVINIINNEQGICATIDSPSQGAKGIPAEITIEENKISVLVNSINASYVGEYIDNKFNGKFCQNGMSFPLELTAGEYVVNRPQTPEGPFPYETRDVKIINPVDSAILAATITLPIQYYMPIYKDFPTVVMVTGSGLQNRDEELAGHKPFAVISHFLALNGIITVRYDDRGFAQSTGNLEGATTATFASDAKAVVDYARNNIDRIDKVGVLGHSEGGSIAFMLAANGDADFGVSLAGPAIGGDSILIIQNYQLLKLADEQMAEDYTKALSRLLKFMQDNHDAKEWTEIDENTSGLQHLSPDMKKNLQKIILTRNAWIDYFINYDPKIDIQRIKVPVMAIYGSLDKQVDANANISAIESTLPFNDKNFIKVYPNLNHLFQHAKTGMPNEYPIIEETISSEVLSDIANWIKSLYKY